MSFPGRGMRRRLGEEAPKTSSDQRSHYCNNSAFAGPCHDSRVSAFHRRVGTGGTRSPDALSAAAKPGPSEPMTMFDIFVPLCSVTNHTRLLENPPSLSLQPAV